MNMHKTYEQQEMTHSAPPFWNRPDLNAEKAKKISTPFKKTCKYSAGPSMPYGKTNKWKIAFQKKCFLKKSLFWTDLTRRESLVHLPSSERGTWPAQRHLAVMDVTLD
jgi:hypothetical protein